MRLIGKAIQCEVEGPTFHCDILGSGCVLLSPIVARSDLQALLGSQWLYNLYRFIIFIKNYFALFDST